MKINLILISALLSISLAGTVLGAPGDYPYPVYGKVTATDGKPISGQEIRALTPDGKIYTAFSDKQGRYQLELTTEYIGKTIKIGAKGQEQDYTLTGSKAEINLGYQPQLLKNAAIGSGVALIAAAGYWYYRRTRKKKKKKAE